MKPDATLYNPDSEYLRSLINRAGLTQRGAARLSGVPERTMRDYLNSNKGGSVAPYTVQFALECLAGWREGDVWEVCGECSGSGLSRWAWCGETCPECNGSGRA